MFFGPSDDALALRAGLREVLSTACSPAVVRAAWDGDPCEALWKTLGSFGLPGLLVPEDRGGLGLDELSFVAAIEEAGWHGAPGPLVETLASAPLLDLPLDGSARVTVMHRLAPLPYALTSTHALDITDGPALLDLTAMQLDPVTSVDASRQLADVHGRAAALDLTDEQLGRLSQRATLGTAAFLIGLSRRMLDLTVTYVRDRQQFGVPIGSFQAVKHPLADALVGVEFAAPAVLRAAQSLVDDEPDAHLHVAMAKALASDAAWRVGRTTLQAHGAMGYTVEYDLHLFAKRAWALAADWGSAAEHRRTIATTLLDEERTAR